MTAAEKLYQLIQSLSEQQIAEILNFAEFLQQKEKAASSKSFKATPYTNQTGTNKQTAIKIMRGLLKTKQPAPTDEDIPTLLKERRMKKFGL